MTDKMLEVFGFGLVALMLTVVLCQVSAYGQI